MDKTVVTLLAIAGIVATLAAKVWMTTHAPRPTTVIADISTIRRLSQQASWDDARAMYPTTI